MKVLGKEKKLCLSCMEEHEVQYVEIIEENIFRGVLVQYPARFEYCLNTEEFTTFDVTLDTNDISFKNAYRAKIGLLTSEDIINIRDQYGVSQKDFSIILGWGSSTITRYEGHQVQDSVHDDVLRKVRKDPSWFIELIRRSKGELSPKAYAKYESKAKKVYYIDKNYYLIDAILALYADIGEESESTGGKELDLDKVVEIINYLAQKLNKLHKVKLMKMLWYSDFLNYKFTNKSLTGLAYQALPMGAVPIGYEEIVLLEGVKYNEILYTDFIGYEFIPTNNFAVKKLTREDQEIINEVISKFQYFTTQEIVDYMHGEEAYKKTKAMEIISYKYALELSI
jgi:putative zinc finger/helix-turn-helix YgiT family protein